MTVLGPDRLGKLCARATKAAVRSASLKEESRTIIIESKRVYRDWKCGAASRHPQPIWSEPADQERWC